MKTQNAVLILLIALSLTSFGQSDPPRILADETEWTDTGARYYGHVEMSWQEYRIFADFIEYNEKENRLTAEGSVTMSSGETVISGTRLVFNLGKKTGIIEDSHGMMPPSVNYTARNMEMIDRDTLGFNKLNFTSCSQRVPRWSIVCSKGKIKKEKYIEMKNVVLKVKKLPIFYFPYMRYPLTSDGRATGFLFPNLGYSSTRGFFVLNSFFWDIRPNLDLTLNVDYYAKVGLGLAQEFRYMLPGLSGKIKFYFMDYKQDSSFSKDSESDYYFDVSNTINLGFLDSKIVVKADYPSDPNFLRLFNNNFDMVLQTRFGYSAFWSSSYRNMNLSVQVSKNETFYTFNNQSRVLENIPSLRFNLNQQKIWKIPGRFSMNISAEKVRRSGVSYAGEPVYASDFTSGRLSLVPSYQLNFLKIPWLNGTLDLQSRHSIYAKSNDPVSRKVVDDSLHLYYNSADVRVKGPVLFRIYNTKNSRIKHLIEPELEFKYVQQVDAEDLARLIRVDRYDLPPYSFLSFSLSTALLYKKNSSSESAMEVLRYTVSQRYYIDAAEANMFLKIDGEYPDFSELNNTLRLRLSKDFDLDFRANYNYYIKDFRNINLSLAFNPDSEIIKSTINLSYYKNPYMLKNYAFNRTILRGFFQINHPDIPLKLISGADYDFTEKKFRYGSLMLMYNYQCVIFNTEFKVFLRGGKNDYQIRFGVSLGNLGMVSDLMSSREY